VASSVRRAGCGSSCRPRSHIGDTTLPRLKIAVVSNEGRELNAYRIRKFKLDGFVDSFVSSCFVHVRKPDEDIYRLALDTAQAKPERVV